MNKLIGINGKCNNCEYHSISWHRDINEIKCNKCDGLIKIISIANYIKNKR